MGKMNDNTLIYKKEVFKAKGKNYIQIGFDYSIDRDSFLIVIALFKKHSARFLKNVKTWIILEENWIQLKKEVDTFMLSYINEENEIYRELSKQINNKKK